MAGVEEDAGAVVKLGKDGLVVGEGLQAIVLLVAEVDGDVGNVCQEFVDAFYEVFAGFGGAGAAPGVHLLEAEGAAEVDVPFELAQVVVEVALVGIGLATGEVANIEAGKGQAGGGDGGADHGDRPVVVDGRALGLGAEEFEMGEAGGCGEVEDCGQQGVGAQGRAEDEMHYSMPSQCAHWSPQVSKRMSLASLREKRPINAMRILRLIFLEPVWNI